MVHFTCGLMSALVICQQRKEYGHTLHWMALLIPGVIMQHKNSNSNLWSVKLLKVKVVACSPDIHDFTCSTDFTFPLARWAPMQPTTIDLTLDLSTRYPLQLGWLRQCGIRSLPDTSTNDQCWEIKPQTFWSWVQRPIDLARCSHYYGIAVHCYNALLIIWTKNSR